MAFPLLMTSIAMATYNGEKYLQEQLESFLGQTCLPDELVVCDDGSSDSTMEILRGYRAKSPFQVKILHNDSNLGICQTFGRALSECSGDLVFLSDQDDVWFSNKLETVKMEAQKEPLYELFINNAELTQEDLTPTGLTKLGQLRSAGISDKSLIMGCCVAVRKDFLRSLLPIPKSFSAHDSWLVGFAQELGRKRIIEDTLQYYRRHKSNSSQYVANQTRRINRYDRITGQIRKSMTDPGYGDLYRSQENLNQFLYRAETWASDTEDEVLRKDLVYFIERVIVRRGNIEERIKIKKRSRLLRLFCAARLLRLGVYKDSGGLQGWLRDVIF